MTNNTFGMLQVTRATSIVEREPSTAEARRPNRQVRVLAERSERLTIAPNQRIELALSSKHRKATKGPPAAEILRAPAIREMLESDNYQIALLLRSDWERVRGSAKESFSALGRAVVLPISWKEMVVRVFESLRDSCTLAERKIARFGDVCVDFAKREVSRLSGEPIRLLNQEFKTLECFLSHPDRVFSRDELLNVAWGYENFPTTRTVDNHILRLRQKLERDPTRPVHFRTVHKVGYKFVP